MAEGQQAAPDAPDLVRAPVRAPSVDASPGPVRESLRTGRAIVAATVPALAAKMPRKITWPVQPVQPVQPAGSSPSVQTVPAMPFRESPAGTPPAEEVVAYASAPAAGEGLPVAESAQLALVFDGQLVPVRPTTHPVAPQPTPWIAPKVAKPPWNVLAIMALPLAFLFPLIGFITGLVAARQVRKNGQRGALLATFGWIVGLGLSIYGTIVLTVIALAFGVKEGVEAGIKDLFMVFLQWLFGS
jgi:hypothetical protein